MRHIPLRSCHPDPEWEAKAEAVLQKLRDAPDAEARKKIIDKNNTIWSDLKSWLLALSHQKCWFSEAKDCFSHWDVEHFRPKKSAKDMDGTSHEGYWWLAFDWTNFRICGNAGNRKKSTYFPLRPGCARTMAFGDTRYEEPLLLDPIDDDDPCLLSFNVQGRAIPSPDIEDEWEKARVKYSVERYNLDFPPLMDKRKVVWSECWNQIEEYRRELATYHSDNSNLIAREGSKKAAKRIREMMQEQEELSAVARACVLSSGDPRVVNLLQTA